MTIIIIITIVSLIAFLYLRPRKVLYLNNLLIPMLCVIFIICLILFPKMSVSAALKGINMCINIVLPSLFPFLVASELLNHTNFIKASGILLEPIMRPLFNVPGCGSFATAMGMTSGYPVGAKIVTDMREKKMLTKTESERLLAFTNNSGPLFIVGAVATGMFNIPKVGILLLTCHILAGLTVGFIFRFYKKNKSHSKKQTYNILSRLKKEIVSSSNSSTSFGIIFGESIKNSIILMLNISGFIIFFSVIINMLIQIGLITSLTSIISSFTTSINLSEEVISSMLCGFFEITTGTNMISNASSIPLIQKLTIASAIIGWAGISVHSQVLSIISQSDLSAKPYLMGKALQGLISAIYTFVGLKFMSHLFIQDTTVFNHSTSITHITWNNSLISSSKNLLYITILFILLNFLLYATKKFVSKSHKIS